MNAEEKYLAGGNFFKAAEGDNYLALTSEVAREFYMNDEGEEVADETTGRLRLEYKVDAYSEKTGYQRAKTFRAPKPLVQLVYDMRKENKPVAGTWFRVTRNGEGKDTTYTAVRVARDDLPSKLRTLLQGYEKLNPTVV